MAVYTQWIFATGHEVLCSLYHVITSTMMIDPKAVA